MVERKLWGKLVNDTRQLAIKLAVYIPVEREEDRMFFRRMIPNVAFAMKEHLRDSILIGEMDTVNDTYQNEIIKSKHRPNCLNKILYSRIVKLNKEGIISNEQLIILDQEIKGLRIS